MITLKQIKRDKGIISAVYYPEADQKNGFIAVDVNTGTVVDFTPAPGYGSGGSARYHGQRVLAEMADMKKLPTERKVMWY